MCLHKFVSKNYLTMKNGIKPQIKDFSNFLKRLNGKRLYNMWKVLSSYYWSRITKKPVHTGYPISISVEPTTSCNLRCPECPSGLRDFSRPTGMLEPDTFKSIVNQVKDRTFYLTLYFQGEPYLNKDLFNFVEYAESQNIYTSTSTNAHYLHDLNARRTVESGLSRMIISIDGTTQETYESYRRGGKLEKVLEGARNIEKWKKQLGSSKPYTIFQFLVVHPNEHQTEEVKQLGKEIGVDEVKFKSAQVYEYKNGNPLIPNKEQYSRYKKQKDGTFELKNKLLNHCWRLWHSCVFTWDGQVVPCCFDKDASHVMGDLKKESFEELWQGEAYQRFRGAILKSRKEIDICANCSEGTKVWI